MKLDRILGQLGCLLIATATAMIGYTIHSSGFWAVINFFLWPLSWIWWLIFKEVNLSIIKATFAFFLA